MKKTSPALLEAFILAAALCVSARELCIINPILDGTLLTVTFTIADGAYLYADSVNTTLPDGVKATKLQPPTPSIDPKTNSRVFKDNFALTYRLSSAPPDPLKVTVEYQGCDKDLCLLPQSRTFDISPSQTPNITNTTPDADTSPIDGFNIIARHSGYLGPADFIKWADAAAAGAPTLEDDNPLARTFRRFGLWLALLLVIPLGFLLNLTPCVLPMIPINLAIIGAGDRAASRMRGFQRGLLYGAGMALAYGVLGVTAALSGGRFASLNSTAWFNWLVAAIFIVLALAMFDVFSIDLSRWRGSGKPGGKLGGKPGGKLGGKLGGAVGIFFLGAVAAILAGACVAPVLIWAILLAAELYSQGRSAGLALPFMLGIGMALPWPLLGAGLAAIPKPGTWMNRVRQAFGILIILFALFYLWTGIKIASPTHTAHTRQGWHASLEQAVNDARLNNKTLFIDFTGVACKACKAMDKATFRNDNVIKRIENWAKVEVLTDGNTSPYAAEIIKALKLTGVPTCILATPVPDKENQHEHSGSH